MKVFFDENVPWPLRKFLPDHEITSVQREGFGGTGNGELLALIDGRSDVFILCDKNIRYQQNLKTRTIAIVELPTNRWPVLQSIRMEIAVAVAAAAQGTYRIVGITEDR